MGRQTYSDESNWKHEPHAEHYVEDKFEKGNETRNWNKNTDTNLTKEEEEMKTKMNTQANNPSTKPSSPKEKNKNHTEIDPAKPATNTEVDLDRNKVKTYPEKKNPERH